ncbi:MAG: hypothetical protein ACREDL_08140, partial [Bradyrhizobium sp.]
MAAMVGRGVVGASAALDSKISLSRAVIQLAGSTPVCEVHIHDVRVSGCGTSFWTKHQNYPVVQVG